MHWPLIPSLLSFHLITVISTIISRARHSGELGWSQSGWIRRYHFVLSEHIASDGVDGPIPMEASEISGGDAECFIQVFQLFAFGFRDETGRTESEERLQKRGPLTHK